MPTPEEREKYYAFIKKLPSAIAGRQVKNKAFQKIYMHETEPPGELPTHNKCTTVLQLEGIMTGFIGKLMFDAIKGSRRSWLMNKTDLVPTFPNREEKVQPLNVSIPGVAYNDVPWDDGDPNMPDPTMETPTTPGAWYRQRMWLAEHCLRNALNNADLEGYGATAWSEYLNEIELAGDHPPPDLGGGGGTLA